jgi:putative hydrolase of the HAD superfamily
MANPKSLAKIPIRGVIFDYGNVICHTQLPSDMESMAQVAGIPTPRFRELYWKFRLPYDRADVNGEAYWQMVAGEEKTAFRPEQIAELTELDTQGWARVNDKTVKWIEKLHAQGLRLGLLSNMPADLSQYLKNEGGWVRFFHHLTFSCDVRLAKPDPLIYDAALRPLGLAPEEVLFLDDLAPNIEAASKLGIHGVIFDTLDQTAERLRDRFDIVLP